MAVKILNIEAGKRFCKVCLTEKKGKSVNISRAFTFPTPEEAVSDGHIVDTIALGNELINQLNANDIKVKDAIFSVTSSKISGREVTLPTVKDDMIRNMINTNVSDYFPIDVTKYSIDFMVLDKNGNESRVLVVAVPNTIIESYINLGDAAGLKIRALDYSSNSEFKVISSIQNEGVGMFVTVEPDFASVIFAKDGTLLLQRIVPFGGDEMISYHMQKNGITDFIDGLKSLYAPCAIDMDEYDDSVSRLVGGVSRSVDFFRSSKFGDSEIKNVILVGSCSHLTGLKEKIAASVGIDTVWLEELDGVAHIANSINDISYYIGCLGAGVSPMKFLPKAYLDKIGGNNASLDAIKEKYGFMIGGICLAIAIGLVGKVVITNVLNKAEITNLDSKIAQVQYAQERFDTYTLYQNGETNLSNYVNGSLKNNSRLVAFFEELEEKMPKNISLLSASCTEGGVGLNITVTSYEEAAMVLKQFRTFKTIAVVSHSSLSYSGGGAPQVSFSVNCTYRSPEEIAAILAESATAAPAEETTATTEG